MVSDDDDDETLSPALLSRPAIRAQMEAEVKQIADGNLDKADCLEKNLSWFESRFNELEESLSRQRVKEFASDLCPTSVGLRHWKRLGAFEPTTQQQRQPNNHSQKNRKRNKRSPRGVASTNNKKKGTKSKSAKRKQSTSNRNGRAKPRGSRSLQVK